MPTGMTIGLSSWSMDDAKAVADHPIMRKNVRDIRISSFFAKVEWLKHWRRQREQYGNLDAELLLNDFTKAILRSCQDPNVLREFQVIGLTSGLWKERLEYILPRLPNLRSICIDSRRSPKIYLKDALPSK